MKFCYRYLLWIIAGITYVVGTCIANSKEINHIIKIISILIIGCIGFNIFSKVINKILRKKNGGKYETTE